MTQGSVGKMSLDSSCRVERWACKGRGDPSQILSRSSKKPPLIMSPKKPFLEVRHKCPRGGALWLNNEYAGQRVKACASLGKSLEELTEEVDSSMAHGGSPESS